MANNINSFSENLSQLTKNVAGVLAIAEGMNQAIEGNAQEVYIGNDIVLPSFTNVVNRVERAENTIANFIKGKGVIETDDGTYRKIKVTSVPKPPVNITGLSDVSVFGINPNWFFELLQYPRCIIKIDLAGKIESDSDRAYVNRVILESTVSAGNTDMATFFNNNIKGKDLSYTALIDLLEYNNIPYREDSDEVKLPLSYEKYYGTFKVQANGLIKNIDGTSQLWYYLDTLNYLTVDKNGSYLSNDNILAAGDFLRMNDSLFKIEEVVQPEKRIRISYAVGYDSIGNDDTLELYNDPFSEKIIEIGIGINEYNIIYVKGVNENYNLLSRNWSNPIAIYTNDLVFENNVNISFAEYYAQNVADFGKEWIAQVKSHQIQAYNGTQPTAPTLVKTDFKVVQINKQLDATLDKDEYNRLTSQIMSLKSNISAVRSSIMSNKDLLIQISNVADRQNVQNIINTDTENLNSLTTQYSSLVNELNTLLTGANVISYSPKYHIRGFFDIPESVNNEVIIGFDIMYRYLHTDETGVSLDTYNYTSNQNNNTVTESGVFTDWNMITSATLSKNYDASTDSFVWSVSNPMNSTEININQVDIPIRSGEKVEFKVRSISEAGYPYSPLKSDWSNSVIIEFPDTLTSDDSVTTILNSVKSDMISVTLQNTISAAGVYTHLSDNNSSFKHKAGSIEYSEIHTDEQNVTTVTTMSLQDKIDSLNKRIAELEKASQ